ncbi:hypothetical protein [Streptomyces sp. NPDC002587]
MHSTKPSRARRARLLVPSALAVAILSGAAAPAAAVEMDHQAAHTRAVAAGPVDDLVKGILDAIRGLLPPGISLPDIKIPEIKLPELKLPEIPGMEIPVSPGLEPPTLPDPGAPVEIVPELPDVEIPESPDPLGNLP